MVIDPLNRDESQRVNGRNPTTTRKCMAVTVTASSSRPDPAAMPMAADSHTAAPGGQPVDRTAPKDDDACTEKADARNDLSRDTRRVNDDESVLQDVSEAVLADKKDQRGRGADDRLRADACALALDLALEADQCGQPERDKQLDDLTGALSRSAEEMADRRPARRPCEQVSPEREHAMAIGALSDSRHGDPNAGPISVRVARSCLAAGVAEWLGTGLQSRLHGFESRGSVVAQGVFSSCATPLKSG